MIVYIGYELVGADGWCAKEQAFSYPDTLPPGVAIASASARLVLALQASVDISQVAQIFKIVSATVEDDRHVELHAFDSLGVLDAALTEG